MVIIKEIDELKVNKTETRAEEKQEWRTLRNQKTKPEPQKERRGTEQINEYNRTKDIYGREWTAMEVNEVNTCFETSE